MLNKVSKEDMNNLPYIIAVDFDGTLVEDKFPDIGRINKSVWDDVFTARKQGAKIILWTSRDGQNLKDAVEFCTANGLYFDAINENLDMVKVLFNNDTRKVYANEYWDDKSIPKYSKEISILDAKTEEVDWGI